MTKPTESELEILQILWSRGPSTVRQVHDELARSKDSGYTTTLKLMQIMHEKGLLSREEESRSHVYAAAVAEEATRQTLLNRFVETTFRGSAAQLVMQALGNAKTSPEELDEIQRLIAELSKKQ
ncbi:BlaI/MecI/CopY family transcriptional regulator [Tellurirhabdus rosea]|uniref:BlaI/MecI/CopY family transcriptional regulator n=1 Tax=Tellurirhabdus rosea TaxID=2674997 RepID=UPI00224EF500|nr:BlaI/MecI/CopY family transcriptional regulator [Tellurirhabdus rosea]